MLISSSFTITMVTVDEVTAFAIKWGVDTGGSGAPFPHFFPT